MIDGLMVALGTEVAAPDSVLGADGVVPQPIIPARMTEAHRKSLRSARDRDLSYMLKSAIEKSKCLETSFLAHLLAATSDFRDRPWQYRGRSRQRDENCYEWQPQQRRRLPPQLRQSVRP